MPRPTRAPRRYLRRDPSRFGTPMPYLGGVWIDKVSAGHLGTVPRMINFSSLLWRPVDPATLSEADVVQLERSHGWAIKRPAGART